MTTDHVVRLKATLDELAAAPDLSDRRPPPTADQRELIDEAIDNFRRKGPELLDDATPFLWEYYRSVAGQFTAAERQEWEIPELDESTDIWTHVGLTDPPWVTPGDGPYKPGRSYLWFGGNVSWEVEHGLLLVFEEGSSVCKVGPHDGHATNASAYGDLALLGVVFA